VARADHRRQERLARRRIFTRLIIIALILVSTGLIFISRTSDSRFAPLRNVVEASGGRLAYFVTSPIRGIKNLNVRFQNIRTVHSDNERLRTENVELRQYQFRARAVQAKLTRLEAIMDVQAGLDIPENRIAVRIISETRGPFAYSALINAGQKAGIKRGHPVMHETGLLGHVIRVGASSSRVLLLRDLNSRVSVMSTDGEARAVLIGKNDQPPKLDFYDDSTKWKDGQDIITSGDDGVLPQGLPIGQVIRESDDDIRVVLKSPNGFGWAWVYPFDPILTPEDDPALDVPADNAELTGTISGEEP